MERCMSGFTMSAYIKTLKKAAINENISDEEFVRELFNPLIEAGNVKDKNGSQLDLDKTRVSRLLAGKDDVPGAMRKALSIYNIEDSLEDGFDCFVNDILDENKIPTVVDSVSDMIQADSTMNEKTKSKLLGMKNDKVYYLIHTFIEAVKIDNREKTENRVIWQKGNNSIEVIGGDLFKFGFGNRSIKKKNIVCIPVNTTFETKVTTKTEQEQKPLVSENTLHGKWLKRWVEAGNTIKELDKRIADNINLQGLESVGKAPAENGKILCYPIGSIVNVETENAIYYLLAISDFDKNNNARSEREKIKTALEKLLEFYDCKGQGYDLYLPLIGTGRSRAGLSHQESFDLIKEVLLNNEGLIQGHIIIDVESSVLEKLDI